MNAPIALFAYDRPGHLERALASLAANRRATESDLYLFSDGPKGESDAGRVAVVRRILRAVNGFKRIELIEKERNEGLAISIIGGVSAVMKEHGAVIVLEDDLEVAPQFLTYMNEALEFYRGDARIFSVSGYTLPIVLPEGYPHEVFLLPRCSSWGWATWRDRWEQVDWEVRDRGLLSDPAVRDAFDAGGSDLSDMLKLWLDGKLDSWAIRFNWTHFRRGAFSVVPAVSQVRSTGCDGSGVHVGRTGRYEVRLDGGTRTPRLEKGIVPDEAILAAVRRFFDNSLRRRVRRFFRKVIGN